MAEGETALLKAPMLCGVERCLRGFIRSPAKSLVVGLIASLSVTLGSCSSGEPEGPRRPDVVVILIDTLRNDRLSAYGYGRKTSPRLDQLAEEGILFRDVTSQASWTLPSMVSTFTSQYVTAYRDRLPEGKVTLPEAFQDGGYQTVGVISNLSMTANAGFARGFDHFDAGPSKEPSESGEKKQVLPRRAAEMTRDMLRVVDEELDDQGESREPFFLYLHLFDPHAPYFPHAEWDDSLPANRAERVQPLGWQLESLEATGPKAPGGDPNWAKRLAFLDEQRGFYDQEIRYTDDVLSTFLDDLKQRGILDSAVVAVLSDHGEGLWEHKAPKAGVRTPPQDFFYKAHGAHLYQEAIGTPFLLWGTMLPAGREVSAPIENLDLYPTLMEICNLPLRVKSHGRSLMPLLANEPAGLESGAAGAQAWRRYVHSWDFRRATVRDAETGYKLVVPTLQIGEQTPEPAELFHLPSDPHERNNIIVQYPEEAQALSARIDAWFQSYPTESTLDAPDPEQIKILRGLGYTEVDIGR